MVKHAYKLNLIGTSEKAMVPLYYSTEEDAKTALDLFWASGDASSKSSIEMITIDEQPPKYKGVIIKAELLPPEHEMDDWHIGEDSLIKPIPYEVYAHLRYSDAKSEVDEQELLDADCASDLEGWLPYLGPKDALGKRFFYCFLKWRFSQIGPSLLVSLVKDEYEKCMRDYHNLIIGSIPKPDSGKKGKKIIHGIPMPEIMLPNFDSCMDIRDEYPDILMVKLSYPGCIKTRRDIANWDLSKVWAHSEVVWALNPQTLTDMVGKLNIEILLSDAIVATVNLSYLFNVLDSLPVVIFGRDEVFLFIRYNHPDNMVYRRKQRVREALDEAIKNGTLRKVG